MEAKMVYDNTDKGVLFLNKYKQKDTHPDYKGKINLKGKETKIAGWKRLNKETKEEYIYLAEDNYEKTEIQPTTSPVVETKETFVEDFDDEIPF